ncbi:MAG: hypothetical protein L0I24_21385 [Pseudonocardia sp.]|nr:hypothetical protein [Pseudonocardia sp.]
MNPLSYTLVACGEVQRIELLDPVTDVCLRCRSSRVFRDCPDDLGGPRKYRRTVNEPRQHPFRGP